MPSRVISPTISAVVSRAIATVSCANHKPMQQHLTIGLLSSDPGWEILLEQIGAIWEIIPPDADRSPARYSAIVANGKLSAAAANRLMEYLNHGGAVLAEGMELRNLAAAALRQRGALIEEPATQFQRVGEGYLTACGVAIGRLIMNTHARRQLLPTPVVRVLPSEILASTNKGFHRRGIHRQLALLHALRSLPFPTRWRFPGNAPTIFCYRIDSDHGTRQQIEQLHHLSQRYHVPITWFLHTEAHEGWIERFAEFEGDEIGVHCHRHRTFRGYRKNVENIRRAIALLGQQGISPRGFAAPNGFWNPGLADAVADCGFLYSSEFSLAYDDLPFHPWHDWRKEFGGVLQVPIHPVSPGNFRRVGATPGQMIQHYQQALASKVDSGEPIIFYDHPTHQQWGVTEAVFTEVCQRKIPAITMGSYAEWWIQRSKARVEASIENGVLSVQTHNGPKDLMLNLEHNLENRTLVAATATLPLDEIAWNRANHLPDKPPPTRGYNFKMLFHSVEDALTRLRQ
ncbi:MAG: hypothetical protein DYG96_05735 [Chlorobi bacterium CHB2]|nr:hypothetical protein [Chlorobi bacterium CHB2]